MLKFYNTLTRKKEIFKPIKKGIVHLYSCGPTVHDFAHIGNFRCYAFVDLLKRYLKYKGYKVKHVMNITDIDDKTILRSGEEGTSLKEFTKKYTKAFFEDIKTLNIEPATIYPKATEHVNEMIDFVKILVKKGFAYEKLHSVYFDISKFKDYGKLSRVDLSQMKPGARVDLDEYEKEHPGDFTLLKRARLDELRRGIYYDTEWGKSRPGWHLECSVMSTKYLGQPFDIHVGGVDLIFPHHENEIAQSEAAAGKKYVNYWIHNEHLLVDGKKMSKSLGNFYTLRDILKKGYSGPEIRYLLLSTHYRQQLNFTFEGLKAAKNALNRIQDFILKLQELENKDRLEGDNREEFQAVFKESLINAKRNFEIAMDNDLNISKALSEIFILIHTLYSGKSEESKEKVRFSDMIHVLTKGNINELLNFMKDVDSILGIMKFERESLEEEIKKLIQQREQARKKKDYEKADKIRTELKKRGIILEDTKGGIRWKKI